MDIDPQLKERLMLYGGLIPGAISLVLMMSVWYFHAFQQSRADHIDDQYVDENEEGSSSRSKRKSFGPRWMLPILLALGFAGADFASNEMLHLWPEGNNYRFTHAISLIALAAVVEGLISLPILLGFGIRILAYGGSFWMLTEGYESGVFGDTPTFVGYTIVAAIFATMIATVADKNSEETPAWLDSITWLVIAGGTMPILLLNHFSIGAMIPAGIIAVLVSTLITSLIFRNVRLSRGGVTVLVGFILTMISGSVVQTGADFLPSVILLAIAPVVACVPLKGHSGIWKLGIRLIMLIVILGAAGGLMQWSASNQDADESGYYADDYYETESEIEQ
ncbi:MAG: hypothetical protein P1U42_06845 [Phycisphaerales bacterium]|nr:hypothetical protein [Phycisphaerales bacterium]